MAGPCMLCERGYDCACSVKVTMAVTVGACFVRVVIAVTSPFMFCMRSVIVIAGPCMFCEVCIV